MTLSENAEGVRHDAGNLYSDLACYYDQFCAEVDYAEQCAFAQRAFEGFAGSNGRDYLDLACGTGQHLLHMQALGFVPNGLDSSAQMLKQAQLRCPDAHLLLADMAAPSFVEQFDLITCFLYSIHYSHPVATLRETLRNAWRALKPGGVFIFNAVDVNGIRNDKRVVTHARQGDAHLSFTSGWEYHGAGDVLDLRLAITLESADGKKHWLDQHIMTAITLLKLADMLEECGFDVTMLEHDYAAMHPLRADSFNALVLACKP